MKPHPLRRRAGAIGAALALATVTACGGSAAGSDEIALRFWHHTYPAADEIIQEAIQAYTEDNPKVSIEFEDIPAGTYNTRLSSAIATDDAPDIINLLDFAMPGYQNALAPAPPEVFDVESATDIESQYSPGALEGLILDDELYMVPEELNTMALFLNKEIFADAGLDAEDPDDWPETWDDLFELSAQLSDEGSSQVGFNWVYNLDPFWYAQQYQPILAQYGCEVFDADGNAAIGSAECVQAFTETWERPLSEGTGGPSVGQSNPVNGLQTFSDGNQAMALGGPWAPSSFSAEMQDNYAVAPMPQRDPADPKTMLYTYGLSVSSSSEHPEEAWKFLRYLTTEYSDQYLEEAGYITGLDGWQDSPAGEELNGRDVWLSGIETGVYTWRSETWLQEGTAIKEAIEKFSTGSSSVADALTEAQAQLDNI